MKNQNNYGITNFTNAHIESNDTELSLVHYILTGNLNLGNQKFDLNGYKDNYAPKRPKVLFNHGLAGIDGFTEPTDPRITFLYLIGRNEWNVVANDMLRAKTVFKKDNELAVDLYNAYKNKEWTDWSVRWAFTETNGEIDKNAFEEKDNVLYVNSFWVREYSAVFEGKDTGAVTDLMSHLNSYKSNIFKGHISKIHLNSQVQNSEEVETLKTQIAELKTELETKQNKNGEAFDKTELINEVSEYTNKAVLQATKQLTERIKDTNKYIEKISQITLNNNKELSKLDNIKSLIEIQVKKEVNGVISDSIGYVR